MCSDRCELRPIALRRLIAAMFAATLGLAGAQAEEIRVVSFNIDAGFQPHAELGAITRQIAQIRGVDLWGLVEVSAEWVDPLLRAAESGADGEFAAVLGQKAGDDRLLAIYNSDKFRLVGGPVELTNLRFGRRGRSPLALPMRHLSTGTEFWFVINHLHRSNTDQRRLRQAEGLRKWAASQRLPVVAVGTYNLDFDTRSTGRWNVSYEAITKGDVLLWVRPDVLVPTLCSDKPAHAVDFVFVAGAAKNWPRESTILEPHARYCLDEGASSKHRPVEIVLNLP